MFHPWRTLRALTHVTLHWHDDGPAGVTHFPSQTISLRKGLTQVERRCTLTHELVHVLRGPFHPSFATHEEWVVDEASARQIVDFDDLARAMLWSLDEYEVAEELWVDLGTIRARLSTLTDEESAELNRRLDDAEVHLP